MAFVVQKDCITILNNECGFEEKNVRAICDVGKSTKGKHTCGYIGKQHAGTMPAQSVCSANSRFNSVHSTVKKKIRTNQSYMQRLFYYF